MTKTYTILFASIALILALGASPALAENIHLRTITVPHTISPDAIPAATTPLVQQGPATMGPTPPSTGVSGPPSWPCFPPTAPCSSDPAGGYLGALPTEVYKLTTCEVAYNSTTGTGGCGQLWWTFEVASTLTCATAGCPLSVAISAKQGSNTVYNLPLTNIGTLPSPSSLGGAYTEVIYGQQGFGTNWGATVNPTAGNVTITVTTQVTPSTGAKITAKGSFTVVVQ